MMQKKENIREKNNILLISKWFGWHTKMMRGRVMIQKSKIFKKRTIFNRWHTKIMRGKGDDAGERKGKLVKLRQS